MKHIINIVCVCLYYLLTASISTVEAQTYYSIPDTSLRNTLVRNYPSIMTADSLLDVTAAKGMSQDLNLDNSNISDASGLQFFESTGILRLRNNNLTAFPELSSMKGLRRVYVSNNHLTSIPDLSALYQLIDLYVVNNNLTDLASVQGKSTLLYITCSGNQITALPDLSGLVNLQTLIVSYNPISVLPDLSMNTNLTLLDVQSTNIHSIPSLSTLINLKTLACENNSFTDLSGLSSNVTLTTLTAQNNLLSSLPDFSNKPALTSVNISNNNLTFEDIIPLTSLATFPTFIYAPQAELSLPLYTDIRESNNFTYQISIDATLTTDKFTWYKNNIPLTTNNTGQYPFAPVFRSDSGFYSASVNNDAVPGLTLKSNVAQLIVRPCIEISTIQVSVLSSDCREGSSIDVAGTTVAGATLPITFVLQTTSPVKNITSTSSTQFNKIIPGTYVLNVTDSRNCSAAKAFTVDKGPDCQNVFSPDGDGIMDNYFIPDTGTAQIYSTSRRLIKTLTIPAAWDGTTSEASLADAGYYVIVINGTSTIGISLFR